MNYGYENCLINNELILNVSSILNFKSYSRAAISQICAFQGYTKDVITMYPELA